jgi:hypothetical protein
MESQSVTLQHTTVRPSKCMSTVTVSLATPSKEYPTGWEVKAATAIPPQPNAEDCQCMMDSITCVANHTFQPPSEIIIPRGWTQDLIFPDESRLNTSLCALNQSWCLGSRRDTENGEYGAFSSCNSTERGSWILNQFFNATGGDRAACTSAGGIIRESGPIRPLLPRCSSILRQAGPLGTGLFTAHSAFKRDIDGKSERHFSTKDKVGSGHIAILVFVISLSAGVYHLWLHSKITGKNESGI